MCDLSRLCVDLDRGNTLRGNQYCRVRNQPFLVVLYHTCTLLDIVLGEGDRETERQRERERERERGGEGEGDRETERGREREGGRERQGEREGEIERDASDLQYRIAHLQSPGVHHLWHIEGGVLQSKNFINKRSD